MSSVNLDDCMLWARGQNSQGYGSWTVLIDGSRKRAHRVMYELSVGDIPEGMTIDHLCGQPPCINTDHMEVVTMQENIARSNGIPATNARKVTCKDGHPLFGDNLYVHKKMRVCRTCRRNRGRLWEKKNRVWIDGVRRRV